VDEHHSVPSLLAQKHRKATLNSLTLVPAFQLSFRAALSAALAVAIAELLQLQFPLYAMIGAIVVTDLSPAQTRKLGGQRLAGTVLGAAIGAVFSQFLPHGPVAIGFSIFVAMFLSHLLRLEGAAKVTGFTCAIVIFSYQDQSWSYALFRLIETTLGVGVAYLVSLVPKLISDEKREQADS
jgi:uncharacterized membrane protein YgaE (UPF0421/DUF939 family)